jgi:hypothetical protein
VVQLVDPRVWGVPRTGLQCLLPLPQRKMLWKSSSTYANNARFVPDNEANTQSGISVAAILARWPTVGQDRSWIRKDLGATQGHANNRKFKLEYDFRQLTPSGKEWPGMIAAPEELMRVRSDQAKWPFDQRACSGRSFGTFMKQGSAPVTNNSDFMWCDDLPRRWKYPVLHDYSIHGPEVTENMFPSCGFLGH